MIINGSGGITLRGWNTF